MLMGLAAHHLRLALLVLCVLLVLQLSVPRLSVLLLELWLVPPVAVQQQAHWAPPWHHQLPHLTRHLAASGQEACCLPCRLACQCPRRQQPFAAASCRHLAACHRQQQQPWTAAHQAQA
jgi:hypothetical protein